MNKEKEIKNILKLFDKEIEIADGFLYELDMKLNSFGFGGQSPYCDFKQFVILENDEIYLKVEKHNYNYHHRTYSFGEEKAIKCNVDQYDELSILLKGIVVDKFLDDIDKYKTRQKEIKEFKKLRKKYGNKV